MPRDDRFHSPHRWAARLAFPLIVGALLWAYTGWTRTSALPPWACYAVAAGFAVGGILMLRARRRG